MATAAVLFLTANTPDAGQLDADAEEAARIEAFRHRPHLLDERMNAKTTFETEIAKRAEEDAAARTAELAAVQKERSAPRWRSTEGFQKTVWGMSRKDVQRLYPAAAIKGPAILAASMTVADLPSTTSFYFASDKLTDVSVRFRPVGKTRSNEEAFAALADALTEKYGSPAPLNTGRTWQTEATHVELTLAPIDLGSLISTLELSYSSRELEFLRAKLAPKAAGEL